MIKTHLRDFKFKGQAWYDIHINQGTAKKKDENEDLFDIRVLKGIPDYSDVP